MVKATPDGGVSVTGTGSSSSPYLIGLQTALKDAITVADTPTLDLTLAPQSGGKVQIYGNTLTKMSDLKDVADPEGPQVGDSPVWMGTHWEFRPPTTVAPGVIQTANGISGDGSIATPISAKTSGSWGTDPLAAAVWGGVQDLGDETYLDSAGKIRSRPQFVGDNLHPTTDLPNAYPVGQSIMTIGSSYGSANGWGGSATVVTIIGRSGDRAAQWMYRNTSTDGALLIQYRSAGAAAGPWTSWVSIGNPPLPDPIDTYNGTSQTITSTTVGTETPTAIRTTIVNPHATRKLLVKTLINTRLTISGASGFGQVVVTTISGPATAVVPRTDGIVDAAIGAGQAPALSEGWFTIDAAGTAVFGVGASRSTTTPTVSVAFCHCSVIPIRYV